jgi:hypothetical protein
MRHLILYFPQLTPTFSPDVSLDTIFKSGIYFFYFVFLLFFVFIFLFFFGEYIYEVWSLMLEEKKMRTSKKTWKHYQPQLCPTCNGVAYRHGTNEQGYQRYQCLDAECAVRFFDERYLLK